MKSVDCYVSGWGSVKYEFWTLTPFSAFAIEIDGREVFARQLKGAECVPVVIDLAAFRGREVSIAFIVDPFTDPAGDWATPRVVLR